MSTTTLSEIMVNRPNTLLDETQRRTRMLDLVRAIGQVVTAVLVVLLPLDASLGRRLVVVGLTVAVMSGGLMIVRSRRIADPVTAINLIAAVEVVVVAIVIPDLWPAMFVSFALLMVGAGAVRISAVMVAVFVVGTAALGVVASVNGLGGWLANMLIATVAIMSVVLYYRVWASARLETDRRYEQLIDVAGVFFWEVDRDSFEVRDVNGATSQALGFTRAEVIGEQAERFLALYNAQQRCRELEAGSVLEATVPMRHKNGNLVQVRTRLEASDDRISGTSLDISEIAAATKQMRWQARHDGLTGLLNRDAFHEELDEALADRAGGVALLIADLDRFKEINDAVGHDVGDRVLSVLATRFVSSLDRVAIARLGGDEFAFIVTDDSIGRVGIGQVAEQITSILRDHVTIDGMAITTGASIGIGLAGPDTTATELIQQADLAMYQCKRSGERFAFFSEDLRRGSIDRLKLASELRTGIEQREVQLWLQPKIDSRSGRIVGAECLARWAHPQRGLLPPGAFLDLIEVSDAHDLFTDHVIDEGVRLAAACRNIVPDFVVSINVTPRNLASESFPRRLLAALAAHGVGADAITIELTESSLVDDIDEMLDSCRALAALGVSISIDDFGIGGSSLERLRHLPVSEVKIDRSFVSRVTIDVRDQHIVRAVIDLADALDLDVVAEGVEQQLDAEVLTELGCHLLQGFHFGPAIPELAFLRRLAQAG